MAAPLLVELLTEELPPKALSRLMEAFSRSIFEGLNEKNFLATGAKQQPYATPRRLAVVISHVLDKQPDRVVERKGPAVASGLDTAGKPTPALLGFAKSCGVDVAKLGKRSGDKGEYFIYTSKQKGEWLKQHLAVVVEAALKKLPAPKLMRWGHGTAQFVRPVHGVILLHGKKVVPGTVLGIKSGAKTRGHRFLSTGAVTIPHAKDYEKILKQQGKIYASFEARRETITRALEAAAKKFAPGTRWNLGKYAELVDEVTSLVEYPVVLAGNFDKAFLGVPKECLIISMQQHQKYFPLADTQGKLLPHFLCVSNMKPSSPKEIIHGNERVLRARLSDAKFFYDQDRKTSLADRVPRLADVVYHNKLGSQLQRTQQLTKLSVAIARQLNADEILVERAASLCKADLLTAMVGEFPELQGTMGRYYLLHEGEATEVADAVEQHYWPRFAGDALPKSNVAAAVALADRLDSLAGMFGIGQQPTGDKDPFGLRRAALGLIRIVLEKDLPLNLNELVGLAYSTFPSHIGQAHTDVMTFIFDRLSGYLRDSGYSAQEVEAVLTFRPVNIAELPKILKALRAFQQLPEAATLAAANKRIVNITRKAGQEYSGADAGKLVDPAERALFDAMQKLAPNVESRFKMHDYTGALELFAGLKQPVDVFFDEVMVMVEDDNLRENRLALLGDLKRLMNRVADISKLAT